jgi:hypothetical protein
MEQITSLPLYHTYWLDFSPYLKTTYIFVKNHAIFVFCAFKFSMLPWEPYVSIIHSVEGFLYLTLAYGFILKVLKPNGHLLKYILSPKVAVCFP